MLFLVYCFCQLYVQVGGVGGSTWSLSSIQHSPPLQGYVDSDARRSRVPPSPTQSGRIFDPFPTRPPVHITVNLVFSSLCSYAFVWYHIISLCSVVLLLYQQECGRSLAGVWQKPLSACVPLVQFSFFFFVVLFFFFNIYL